MRCSRCKLPKLKDEFYEGDHRCKTCHSARAKLYREKHGERLRTRQNEQRRKPEGRKRGRETHAAWQNTLRGREWRMWDCAKRRAAELGLAFTITRDDVRIPERCPLLDIPIAFGRGKLHAASPSLDRRNATKGYVPGNVWVISYRANAIKQNATVDELEQIAQRLRAYPVVPGLDEGEE